MQIKFSPGVCTTVSVSYLLERLCPGASGIQSSVRKKSSAVLISSDFACLLSIGKCSTKVPLKSSQSVLEGCFGRILWFKNCSSSGSLCGCWQCDTTEKGGFCKVFGRGGRGGGFDRFGWFWLSPTAISSAIYAIGCEDGEDEWFVNEEEAFEPPSRIFTPFALTADCS